MTLLTYLVCPRIPVKVANKQTDFGRSEVYDVYNVRDRLHLINDQVVASMLDPQTRAIALSWVKGVPEHGQESELAEVSRIFWGIYNNVEYRQDNLKYDTYATLYRTLQVRAGDCDDMTICVASLLATIGYLPAAKLISPDGTNWHIYAITAIFPRHNPAAPTSRYIALDTTQKGRSYPGWEPPMNQRRHEQVVVFDESGPQIEVIR